jgi:hypothetical protein
VDEANSGSVFSQMFSSGLAVRTVGFVISTGGDGGRNPMQTATRPGGKVSRQMRGTTGSEPFEAADWKTYHEFPLSFLETSDGEG